MSSKFWYCLWVVVVMLALIVLTPYIIAILFLGALWYGATA